MLTKWVSNCNCLGKRKFLGIAIPVKVLNQKLEPVEV